jgi:hypothetical protein
MPYWAIRVESVTHVTRMHHRPDMSPSPSELPSDLRQWLDSQSFGRLPTLTKDGALKLLNDRGMPVKRNAVVMAFNSKELASAIYSGKRLASEYDVMKWAISRLHPSGTVVSA